MINMNVKTDTDNSTIISIIDLKGKLGTILYEFGYIGHSIFEMVCGEVKYDLSEEIEVQVSRGMEFDEFISYISKEMKEIYKNNSDCFKKE